MDIKGIITWHKDMVAKLIWQVAYKTDLLWIKWRSFLCQRYFCNTNQLQGAVGIKENFCMLEITFRPGLN